MTRLFYYLVDLLDRLIDPVASWICRGWPK